MDKQDINEMAKKAKEAAQILSVSGEEKNKALKNISENIIREIENILIQNQKDILNAEKAQIPDSIKDRIKLDKNRVYDICRSLTEICNHPDPIGRVLSGHTTHSGMKISKISVPIGVIGIIYEARPNVTVEAAALCIKSGNSVILRGGKEAIKSNIYLVELIREGLESAGLPKDCVQIIKDTSRVSAIEMMKMNDYIDLLIPRGGKQLISSVVQNATVPVIKTGEGICHMYIDGDADIDKAVNIAENAKVSRPSVCNSLETLLVHKDIAKTFLPEIKKRLDKSRTEIIGCEKTREILGTAIKSATEEDWSTEYLDYKLSVKVVENFSEAIEHIKKYSSGHSECIVTNNYENSQNFIRAVDAAAIYINASTRFTDGYEFGMGAEIGISTQKIHARGPMGLEQLTSYKYIVEGIGQIR